MGSGQNFKVCQKDGDERDGKSYLAAVFKALRHGAEESAVAMQTPVFILGIEGRVHA